MAKVQPTSLDEAEAQVVFFEKQARALGSSFGIRSHEELALNWAYRPMIEKLMAAKLDIESISRKDISIIRERRFAEQILFRYFGLQVRLYLAYARVAHSSHGYGLSFSFKKLEELNLRISKNPSMMFRVAKPYNVRHVNPDTVEIFLSSQDEQLVEFAALMDPQNSEDYLASLQLSAIRSSIVNRWSLDQAYSSVPEERILQTPTPRFLSYPDLKGKKISETRAYQELNSEMRLFAFETLNDDLQKIIKKYPITQSVGFSSGLFKLLVANDGYFQKKDTNSVEYNQLVVEDRMNALKKHYQTYWEEEGKNIIVTSSLVGDSWKMEDVVQRVLDHSFESLRDAQAAAYTDWLYQEGYIDGDSQIEFNKNKSFLDEFKTEWQNTVRPEILNLMKLRAKEAWSSIRKESHAKKMKFIQESILQSAWTWNILLDTKNSKTDLTGGNHQKVQGTWKLVQIRSAEDARIYFFNTLQKMETAPEEQDQVWFYEFFEKMKNFPDDQANEDTWKRRVREVLSQYESKWMQDWMKVRTMFGQNNSSFQWKKPAKQLVIENIFYLEDRINTILRLPSEYITFAEAKRDELFAKVGVLRVLRKDELAMKRLKNEHSRQVMAYNQFQTEIRKHGGVQYAGTTISPRMPEEDDLFMSLIRAWRENSSNLLTEVFNADMKATYDQARLDGTEKLERLISIQRLDQSDNNEKHRLILQSTLPVRQTFIQSHEKYRVIDEQLMKTTRSSAERANDFLNTTVLYVFYAFLAVGAVTLVVASDGMFYPVLKGMLSGGLIAINIMGVANIATRTRVDFFELPPQMEYQVQYANALSIAAQQEVQHGETAVLDKKEENEVLQGLDHDQNRLSVALSNQKAQRDEKYFGVVWSALDTTGYTEVVKALRPFTKMERIMKVKVIRFQRYQKFKNASKLDP
ncbi:MAG: hypothetical protein KA715_14510 [Xanthomonadaceae bacterium]|nr:hypothetical protein [Xanthomonadaceae bacterium]